MSRQQFQKKYNSYMNVVFFGNTKYSVIDEEALHKKFSLSLVVATPDKPSGRKRELKPSSTKAFAKENNIPVLETDKLDKKSVAEIAKVDPDFLVVADYGLILPNQVLELPKYAAINVHHSLLPKYRGPSPASTANLNGEKISGVTIIKMTWDVDAGDILAQKEYELKENETTDSLLTELNKLGSELIIKLLPGLFHSQSGVKTQPQIHPQDETKASYSHWLTKKDGQVDPENPPDPQTFDRMVRAFYPWPGTWCRLMVNSKWLIVKFLPGNLIQPEGKRPMS